MLFNLFRLMFLCVFNAYLWEEAAVCVFVSSSGGGWVVVVVVVGFFWGVVGCFF